MYHSRRDLFLILKLKIYCDQILSLCKYTGPINLIASWKLSARESITFPFQKGNTRKRPHYLFGKDKYARANAAENFSWSLWTKGVLWSHMENRMLVGVYSWQKRKLARTLDSPKFHKSDMPHSSSHYLLGVEKYCAKKAI